MTWPSLQDYYEAVQMPRSVFEDLELRQGMAEVTKLGLPRPVSGQFATVYTFRCGPKRYAVRCFTREIPDIYERYSAISQRLDEVKLRQTVRFQYLAHGILIRSTWYPIIKMEWVQGELLPKYIERNLANPKALLELAKEFVELFQALKDASIAHGDLQHGNILVVDGQLRLIDYDGMFVPQLFGRRSNETGHRNYQHPNRTGFDFGPGIDAFSAWVIYVSLVALSANPSLWKQFAGGDECLLFRQEDFEKPEDSRLFSAIEADPTVAALGSLFKSLLYLSPSQIPALDGKRITIQLGGAARSIASVGAAGTQAAGWWQDHQSRSRAFDAPPSSTLPVAGGELTFDSAWVLDFVDQPATVVTSASWGTTPRRERLCLLATAVLSVLLFAAGRNSVAIDSQIGLVLTAIGLNVIWWRVRFENLAAVGEQKLLESQGLEAERRQETARRALKQAEDTLHSASMDSGKAQKEAANDRHAFDLRERADREKVDKDWQARLGALKNQRSAIDKQEADSLQRVSSSLAWQRSVVARDVQGLGAACQTEVENRLATIQREYIHACLSSRSVARANVPGISPTLKYALLASGMVTAADISWSRVSSVHGFGSVRTRAVTAWKNEIEDLARRNQPTALPSSEQLMITSKYSAKRATLEVEGARLDEQIRSEEARIRDEHRALIAPVDHAINTAEQQLRQATTALANKFGSERRALEVATLRRVEETAATVRKNTVDVQERRARLLPIQWETAKIRRQLRRYEGKSFGNFARYILSFRGEK